MTSIGSRVTGRRSRQACARGPVGATLVVARTTLVVARTTTLVVARTTTLVVARLVAVRIPRFLAGERGTGQARPLRACAAQARRSVPANGWEG